ncbi:unnamed protein product, partial [Laminaria digitata]
RSSTEGGKFRLGQKVEGRFRGKGRWYKGRVIGVNPGGTYDLRYEDGDEDLGLDASAIKSADGAGASGGGGAGAARNREHGRGGVGHSSSSSPRIGDRVEARVPGTTRWQSATVVGENRDGTLDVRFRDNTEERSLDPRSVRVLEDSEGEEGRRRGRTGTTAESYRVGDKVEARFGGRARWFKGTVQRVNRDGTFHLLYADGDEERAVDKSLMRSIDDRGGGGGARSGSRSPGRRVISGASSEEDLLANPSFREGDKVEARYKRGRQWYWYPGAIRAVNRDGTYDIRYKDGDTERDVDPSLVRGEGGVSADTLASSEEASKLEAEYSRGDKVEARFRGRSGWFKATVERDNRNGTYHLLYEDGDEERAVGTDLMRRVRGLANAATSARAMLGGRNPNRPPADSFSEGEEFAEGDRVEARFGGRSRWFKATVERKNRDGTYFLVYADGDEERSAEKNHIRRLGGDKETSPRRVDSSIGRSSEGDAARRAAIRVGDDIEARYKKGHKWYPGVVRAVNRSGTYDIRYKDGDSEYDVDPTFVRRSSDDLPTTNADPKRRGSDFLEGESVQARFGGRSRWFKAKVERVNRDGTYHLVYADGDEERSVPKTLMRRLGSDNDVAQENKGVNVRGGAAYSGHKKQHRVGDEIDARYKKGRKWYPGTIRAVNRDGTFDIRYADGDTERDVDPSMVRGKDGSSDDSQDPIATDNDNFLEGDKVEAQFGGRSRWFKATVARRHRNGTYSLRYEDGDEEMSVEKHLIRRVGTVRPSASENKSPGRRVVSGADSDVDSSVMKKKRVGDDVEARYKKGRKWFPGIVHAVNRNGTYDIRYKDGDSERDVAPELVRGLGNEPGGGGGGGGGDFSVGDKVEGRFGGRARWFKATIERVHRNGTYDLLYADGDEERNVEKGLVREIGGISGGGGRSGSSSPDQRELSGARMEDSKEPGGRRAELREGDEIEAKYKRGRLWYPGVILTVNRDETFDIRYKDGDSERSVDRGLIRSRAGVNGDSRLGRQRVGSAEALGSSASGSYQLGDKVEARFGGRSRWFKATVHRENSDGTYSLFYADGDRERAVDKDLIRPIAGNAESKGGEMSTDEAAHRVGDDVEARYKRGRMWYPGVIRAVNVDNTYDIRYKDGDSERGVEAALVRHGSSSGTAGRDKFKTPETQAAANGFNVGDKVEARFGGGSRWFKATVKRTNTDGTVDLLYADGDKERGVESYLVRKRDGGGNGPERLRDSSARRAVPGADSETDVESGEGKVSDRQGGRCASRRKGPPRAGEEVEARSRGGSRWVPGSVSRVHRDGSYDIDFENGDSERHIPANHVRHAADGGETTHRDSDADRDRGLGGINSRQRKFAALAGDRVEARFHGRSTWRRGEVIKVHSDGTYDIVYDDDQRERRVDPDLVRLPLNATSSSRGNDSRRGIMATSSDDTEESREKERGRSKERGRAALLQEPAGEDAELAATRIRRALRKTGKTVDDLTRKLERTRKTSDDDRDKRGNRGVGGVDKSSLKTVLASIGVEISPNEARALSRCCPDAHNDHCFDPLALASLVRGGDDPQDRKISGGSADRKRSPKPHGRGHPSSSSPSSSGSSAVLRRRSRGASRQGGGRSGSSGSSRSRSSEEGKRGRRSSHRNSRPEMRGVDRNSDSEGGGNTSSEGRADGALVGKSGVSALKKLGDPAFDGSMRREFDKLSGGRRRELPTTSLKPLLRRLRVKLDGQALVEVVAILDTEGTECFSLEGLFEAALSVVEEKKVAKVHAAVSEQIFTPSSRGGKRKNSEEAKAAIAKISKALSKMDHPKGSGLLEVGDMKNVLQKAGAKVRSADAQVLSERLDPADRGKIDREALVTWLTSGLDPLQVRLRKMLPGTC